MPELLWRTIVVVDAVVDDGVVAAAVGDGVVAGDGVFERLPKYII